MKAFLFAALSVVALTAAAEDEITQYEGYELVWHDEFDVEGKPNPDNWSYERGFQRNHEDQWYQEDNAFCEDGKLIIEGRKQRFKNPDYGKYSDWRNREYVDYTSSCITTDKKHSWTYGRFIIRAKIPAYTGCWPAIWLLGQNYDGIYGWPHNGEIDIMEFYQVNGQPHILANACWGGKWSKWDATWDSEKIPYSHFLEKDADWGEKYHEWRMDWDVDNIKIYLDDELLNTIPLADTENPQTDFFGESQYNPFDHPQYLLLNLALGGDNGGSLDSTPFPCRYEIDYVRVYQEKKEASVAAETADNAPSIIGGKGSISIASSQIGDCNVSVSNAAGNVVFKSNADLDNSAYKLPAGFARGIYMVAINSSEATYSYKVAVK